MDAALASGGRRRRLMAVPIVVAAVLSGCGGKDTTRTHTVTVTHTTATVGVASRPRGFAPSDQVLALSGLGTFRGRCPRGARTWVLHFVADAGATDTLSYQVGRARRRTVNVDPGRTITFRLVPEATRTREPADRFTPPIGQGRGRASATTVASTQRLHVIVYQGTEPQTLRANVSLALAAIGGESGQCVLVGSTANADTYPNS